LFRKSFSLLRNLDNSLERNHCRRRLPVARRQVTVEVETAVTGRTSVTARTAGNTERNRMRSRSGAVNRVNRPHERIGLDEYLISTPWVSVGRLQIKNFIGGGVGARRKDGGVEATLGIDALAGET